MEKTNINFLAIIQARMNSTRLPKKVMLPLAGKPLFENVYERVSLSKKIDKVIIATTTNKLDDKIVDACRKSGIEFFRGSEEDVLDRYYQAATHHRCKNIIRITADCPLTDYKIIDKAIDKHLAEQNDYTATAYIETFPDGLDVDIFTYKALAKAWKEAKKPFQREHITQYFAWNPDKFKIGNLKNKQNLSTKRWVVDEPEDYIFMKKIYNTFSKATYFGMDEILAYLKKHPEIESDNHKIIRNEGLDKKYRAKWLANKKQGKGQNLYKYAKKIIPGGTQLLSKRPEMHLPNLWPSYYKKAKGCEIWDLDGKKYIDMSYMGIGACVLGYADKDVDSAVKNAIKNSIATTLNSPLEIELAELLFKLHPWASMARFACTGGEALAIAIRIARAKSGKDKVLFCGYHGWHDWYLASNLADDKALDGHLIPGLKPLGVPRALKGTSVPFSYNDTKEFLRLIKLYKKDVGVVIIEPLRNSLPDKKFLKTIRQTTKKNNIVLVIDEVSAGFRLTTGGAHMVLGIKPDIAVFSKALGNGYPVSAIIGRKAVMSLAEDSFISSTNWTNSIGLAAAIATIRKFKKQKTARHLIQMGNKVKNGWEQLAKKHNLQIHISGAINYHFEFEYSNPLTLKTLFTKLMLNEGFLATTAFYASLSHQNIHIKKYLNAVDKVFATISLALKNNDVEWQLRNEVCHAGFRRLT